MQCGKDSLDVASASSSLAASNCIQQFGAMGLLVRPVAIFNPCDIEVVYL